MVKLPVIVFLDGHKFCSQYGVILVALFPNAIHITQPMDVGLFHNLKSHWKQRILNYRMHYNGQKTKKEDLCHLLKRHFGGLDSNVLSFRTCGLYPSTQTRSTMQSQ